MSELKPVRCGCGGEAKVDKHTYYRALPTYGVRCHRCGQETRQFYMTEAEAIKAWNKAMGERTEKVIHCIDCAYWMDECVYLNDGRIRKYSDGETFVEVDVGINEGAKCLYDEEHGVHLDGYAIFRQSCDFCSKAEKRPFEYDTWFGIKDGIYARRWKDYE